MSLPSLEQKIAFLSKPEVYPITTQRVETKETHMAWVFLTDTQAWKLKKPVRYDYLDFSTLEARRKDCEEEVRLNRRLAHDVYIGMTPLTIDQSGSLRLDGSGETVDWLVNMRRLPAGSFLDRRIADRTVSVEDARRIGATLAEFYRKSPPVAMTAAGYRKRLTVEICASYRELGQPKYGFSTSSLESITRAQLKFLEENEELFDRRVRAGKIIEAHGDLRPEHICLESEPVIIDCLEFNRDFRILDTVSELAFLALECERLGAPQVGELILESYSDETGDRPPVELWMFYRSYHACLRAKVALWHLRDRDVKQPEKWMERAKHYLKLASCIAQKQ